MNDPFVWMRDPDKRAQLNLNMADQFERLASQATSSLARSYFLQAAKEYRRRSAEAGEGADRQRAA